MATRRTLLALRDAMSPDERGVASTAICDAANAVLSERLARGAVVAMYAAKDSEVETARLDQQVRAQGFAVAYPRVVGGTRLLTFHAVATDELATGRFGLREPSADARAIAVTDIAAFLVPGLAFDRGGGRIGWGRGHYDATFAAAAPGALRIGLAFECQLVEQVAREPHDVALHIIITEVATYSVA